MLFINFTAEGAESFKSKYREAAELYKHQGVSFLVGDVESSQGAFQVCIKTCDIQNMEHLISIFDTEYGLS